jgi:hypothetical protein
LARPDLLVNPFPSAAGPCNIAQSSRAQGDEKAKIRFDTLEGTGIRVSCRKQTDDPNPVRYTFHIFSNAFRGLILTLENFLDTHPIVCYIV